MLSILEKLSLASPSPSEKPPESSGTFQAAPTDDNPSEKPPESSGTCQTAPVDDSPSG